MNIVIWNQSETGGGGGIELLLPAINVLIRLYGNINIVGAICPPGISFTKINTIDRQNLKSVAFDLILVTGEDVNVLRTGKQSLFVAVLKEAAALGIDTEKIVLDRVVLVPNFTLEKYVRLRRSALSILSVNCFGGMLYHRFGLPFLSPTINMFTSDEGFLKFLQDPMRNVKAELKLVRTEFNADLNINYPVFKIGESEWDMNHYADENFAVRKWYERGFRINWFNLLVAMHTENPEILAEFDKLPFAKKVCFVPFETNLDSGFYVNRANYNNDALWRLVNGIASGGIACYDMWDMLLYGKKTPLT